MIIVNVVHDRLRVLVADVEPLLGEKLGHDHLRVSPIFENDAVFNEQPACWHELQNSINIVFGIAILVFVVIVYNLDFVLDHVLENFG